MSAPAQVSSSQISLKSSPPVSPRMTSAKEAKPPAAQKPHLEKIKDQSQQAKAPSSGQAKVDRGPSESANPEASQAAPKVGLSTCPLCKAELNIGSKDLPNYNTCTECRTNVCNKCGFSPMLNVTEGKEWLCLTCQMQRALGASEPPGLPMIKPSPSKEVPVTIQKQETPISTSQEDIHKTDAPKKELANVATTKETKFPALGPPTNEVSPIPASLPDKTAPSIVSKTEDSQASQKYSGETPQGQPGIPQQQAPKAVTSTTESVPPPDTETGKPDPQEPPKVGTSIAKSVPAPDQEAGKPPTQDPPKAGTSIAKSAPPPDQEAGKPPTQEPPKAGTSIAKSAPPPNQEAGKPPTQEPPKAGTSVAKSTSSQDREVGKPPPQQPPKAGTSPAKSIPPPAQPAKQESGGFFGFGGPKTQPAAKSAESVTGKMFGFGSSFLNSASTLINSAVQDDSKATPPTPRKMSTTAQVSPKTTPTTPRKMSTTAHVSPKTTPPASPKTLPAKDTKPPAVQKTEEKKPEKSQQEKTLSTVQTKVDKAPSGPPKEPTDTKVVPKADLSICPLCKVDLNMGATDPPNYNTCTECKTTVCNQCGFNPMPNVAEVFACH
ncbi:protein piccolo-like [Morone saxatilis]|uniref:protein piccolo-like n=1 Tax=Morone saxatilis TaxID=34816 RepID=UPI0015E249A0|nr:protein piccolo-like [Morone saxatilis]